ncbi:MAG: family 10 glycosylhydrolase [Candidatus Eisenbacteria bacterium]|nr:family 10 glycosylhydrolase [Candidatus Eisenbacteria bacterium]
MLPETLMMLSLALAAVAPAPESDPLSAAGRPGPRGDGAAATPRPAAAADTAWHGPGDFLWVTRSTLLGPGSIARMVDSARAAGVRGLLVQVVGRGDAFYRSDLLPRSEALGRPCRNCPDFDPLGLVVERAHAAGLEVHAWMNCALVWSAPKPPRDPLHVLNAHPEWIARLPDGRPMTRLSAAERRRLGIEGVYLSPARPAVRAWIASIAKEIASRYAVDGIHLDYIRQPGEFVGYDPDTRARFALESGVDPARIDRLPAARRPGADSAWAAFQSAQVTAIVREVRDSLQAARPGLPLSAAVLADTVAAERRRQDWRAWLRDGLLDRVFVMCYAPDVQTVLDQMVACAGELGTARVVPGIAVFNSTAAAAAAKIRGALELGYRTLALYSYDVLDGRPGYWAALRASLGPPPAAPATQEDP